ncbi:MAG: Uma2 family endonuclease [Armatimonadetes bacterium]|nr:Uma2 family endonuclease [Armatimonadota bacterium]
MELLEQRLWTRREYEKAAELGLFGPDERLELIEGRIVRKVTQNTPHTTGTQLAQDLLTTVFAHQHTIRVQQPLALDDYGEPEPDVAVVVGAARDFSQCHPATAVLVVEVADSSLSVDQTTKAGMYARAGIPEYWILNLVSRMLEVHREPSLNPEQPLGHHYRNVLLLSAADRISPLAAPQSEIQVADLLP